MIELVSGVSKRIEFKTAHWKCDWYVIYKLFSREKDVLVWC